MAGITSQGKISPFTAFPLGCINPTFPISSGNAESRQADSQRVLALTAPSRLQPVEMSLSLRWEWDFTPTPARSIEGRHRSPGMDVAVQSELGFVLKGCYGGSVSEAPQFGTTVCRHWKADRLLVQLEPWVGQNSSASAITGN